MNAATQGMMTKVRALLDKAEATDFPAEAATYRAKAEELMVKYRIEEEQLIAKDETAILPINVDIRLSGRSPYINQYAQMFTYIARHTGIKVRYQWHYDTEGNAYVMAEGVGYESDAKYAELLFTQARLVFAERLEPRIKPDLDDQTNVYRLRSAGIERVRIADMMWGNTDKVFLARVGRLYKAECAARGEEAHLSGRGVTGAAYREQYSEQFVYTLATRLRQASDAAGRAGGGLVLASRKDRIDEAFYTRFPDLRPKPELESPQPAQKCEKCEKAKRGYCNDHSMKGARVSRGRDYYSAAAERGRAAGASAARAVNLGRGGYTESIGG